MLSPARSPQAANAVFDSLDLNHDGMIDKHEFRRALSPTVLRGSPISSKDFKRFKSNSHAPPVQSPAPCRAFSPQRNNSAAELAFTKAFEAPVAVSPLLQKAASLVPHPSRDNPGNNAARSPARGQWTPSASQLKELTRKQIGLLEELVGSSPQKSIASTFHY